MQELQIVSKIRINGQLYMQEEIDPLEFRDLVSKKIDEAMEEHGFTREKTA